MGTKMAVAFSNIFMAKIEREILSQSNTTQHSTLPQLDGTNLKIGIFWQNQTVYHWVSEWVLILATNGTTLNPHKINNKRSLINPRGILSIYFGICITDR